MSLDTAPMPLDEHRRTVRAAERLVESAGWKIGTNVVIPALLAVIAWNFQVLATKVDKIAETLTNYAIQSATNDLRMRGVEGDNARQDTVDATQNADIRTLEDKQAEIKFRLDSLGERSRDGRNP